MATYSTDLTTLTTAESGTWYELTGAVLGFTLSGAGSPSADGENFIQGTDCRSQTTGKAQDAEISIVFDYGSGYSFSTNEVVFGWCYYAVGVNLKTKANSGWMFAICDSLTTGDYFIIGGSDYGRNPYGGWTNVAIDPTATQSGTLTSGGNGGTYRYFGQICNTIGEITKGTPSAVDAIRAGRGVISITGSSGSFSELASYNDYNSGSTPPGTSSTSVDSGYHRLGLFQEAGGTFLWKGLLSLGTVGTSVTFSDSNETIIIDDCPHTYAAFNKVEVNNASSSVTLNNITFISTASTANGIGHFEMVADATLAATGCSFNDMGTFVFDSNSTVTGCSFNSCGLVTQGGATLTGCLFNEPTGTVGLLSDDIDEIETATFVSDGTGHAIELTTAHAGNNYTFTGHSFTGYATSNGTTDAVIYNNSGGAVTITVASGTGTVSYLNGTSATTTIVIPDVTLTLTGLITGSDISILTAGTTTELENVQENSGTTYGYEYASSAAGDFIDIGVFLAGYTPFYIRNYELSAANGSVPIAQKPDRYYLE